LSIRPSLFLPARIPVLVPPSAQARSPQTMTTTHDPLTLLQQHAKGTTDSREVAPRSSSPRGPSMNRMNSGTGTRDVESGKGGSDINEVDPLSLHIGGNSLALKSGLIYTIGSARDAHVHLGGVSVAPETATIHQGTLRVLPLPLRSDQQSQQQQQAAGCNMVFAPVQLNGRMISAGMSTPLRDGDLIQIGHHQIRVAHTLPGAPTASAADTTKHEANTAINPSSSAGVAGGGMMMGAQPSQHIQQQEAYAVPQKEPYAHSRGGMFGQKFADPELDRVVPPRESTSDRQQEQPPHSMQQQQHHSMAELAPGQRGTMTKADGSSSMMAAGAAPVAMESARALSQERDRGTDTDRERSGPSLARLSVNHHGHPETTSTTNSESFAPGSRSSMIEPNRINTDDRPQKPIEVIDRDDNKTLGALPVMQQDQRQQPQRQEQMSQQQIPIERASGSQHQQQQMPMEQSSGSSSTVLPSATASSSSSSLPLSSSASSMSSPSALSSFSSSSSSAALTPTYSTSELGGIMSDMAELNGSRMSDGAKQCLPHWLSLFPAHQRQSMGSTELKEWLKLAIQERSGRLAASTGTAGTSTAASQAAQGLLGHRGGGIGGGGSGMSTDPKELLESDLVFGLLAMQAARDGGGQHHQTQGGTGGSITGSTGGQSGMASTTSSSWSSSTMGTGGGISGDRGQQQQQHDDASTLSLLGDLAEMGSWRLGVGWEAAVRHMLDSRHMSPNRRASFGHSSALKNWLRAAVADRERQNQSQGQMQQYGSGSGTGDSTNGGEISAMNLAHALISSQHTF